MLSLTPIGLEGGTRAQVDDPAWWIGDNGGVRLNPMIEDVTIITACMNRQRNLAVALPSWIASNPDRIIIVDWGSKQPLSHRSLQLAEGGSNIEIHRIEQSRWVLSWAFNEALLRCRTKYVCKLDCDHLISNSFFQNHHCGPDEFLRGHWRYAPKGQQYINGAVLAPLELMLMVGGYDERIDTYGADDGNLYRRLAEISSCSSIFRSSSIIHMEQAEATRTSQQDVVLEQQLSKTLGTPLTKFLIRRNRLFSQYLSPWNRNALMERHSKSSTLLERPRRERVALAVAALESFDHFCRLNKRAANLDESLAILLSTLESSALNQLCQSTGGEKVSVENLVSLRKNLIKTIHLHRTFMKNF